MLPPDEKVFRAALRGDEGAVPFLVVDMPFAVAVLTNNGQWLSHTEQKEAVALRLLREGFGVVAWIGPDADGAAVACCYSASDAALDDSACAICALKAIGGWDESGLMTFCITHAHA